MTTTSLPIHPNHSWKRARLNAVTSGLAGVLIGISATAVVLDRPEPTLLVTAPTAAPAIADLAHPGDGLPQTADAVERWLADAQRRLIDTCTSAPMSADALERCVTGPNP